MLPLVIYVVQNPSPSMHKKGTVGLRVYAAAVSAANKVQHSIHRAASKAKAFTCSEMLLKYTKPLHC